MITTLGRQWTRRTTLAAVLAGLFPGGLHAHTLPISWLTLVPEADYLHAELVLNPFELKAFAELDTNRDQRLEPSELAAQEKALTERLLSCLRVEVAGHVIAAETAGLECSLDTHHVAFRIHYRCDARTATLRLRSDLMRLTQGFHLTQVTLHRGSAPQVAQLSGDGATAVFEPPPSETALATPRPVQTPSSHRARRWSSIPWLRALLLGILTTGAVLWQNRRRRRTVLHATSSSSHP